MYILQPIKFSSFPEFIAFDDAFRLILNVATSRLILTHGNNGEAAAGSVIKAFGEFVIGGNFVVGLVIFDSFGNSILVVNPRCGAFFRSNGTFTGTQCRANKWRLTQI